MEATEKSVGEQHEQIKDEHLTETQRKVFDVLRQLNVHRYCPPANQIAQRAEEDVKLVKVTLTQLCGLGLVILRFDTATGDETYRLCKPEEYTKRGRFVINNEDSVSPKSEPSSHEIVSPKTSVSERKVLDCPKCDFVTKSFAGLQIHIGQKHKTAASIRQKIEKTRKKTVSEKGPAVKTDSNPGQLGILERIHRLEQEIRSMGWEVDLQIRLSYPIAIVRKVS